MKNDFQSINQMINRDLQRAAMLKSLNFVKILQTDTETKMMWNWQNAENFSTKALAIKVVLFTIWWSALAYETMKLLRFEPLNTLVIEVTLVTEEIGLK